MAVGDKYRVNMIGSLFGQLIEYTFHYIEDVSAGAAGDNALATAFDSGPALSLVGVLSHDYTYTGSSAQKYSPLPVTNSIFNGANSQVGGVNAASLPPAVSAVISKLTPFAGPAGRGRVFLAGIPFTYDTSGQLNGTGLAALNGVAAIISQQLSQGGYTFTPCIARRTTGAITRLTGTLVRPVLRCQRRREVGRGA